MAFKYDNRGRVVGVEGVIPLRVEEVGLYKLIPLSSLPELLSERVSGKVSSRDWYITKLGFTSLTVSSVRLTYKVTPEGLLVPVYVFEGEWVLEYDGINDSGSLEGFIVAVAGN